MSKQKTRVHINVVTTKDRGQQIPDDLRPLARLLALQIIFCQHNTTTIQEKQFSLKDFSFTKSNDL
ncbi:MAG: hypothetical protein COA36_04615 [Desulfotalea sp.]|nr:MAG: hypothetical protein COA36_04615 [Desulfotalea sp.]